MMALILKGAVRSAASFGILRTAAHRSTKSGGRPPLGEVRL
jgi:hypothetical protein